VLAERTDIDLRQGALFQAARLEDPRSVEAFLRLSQQGEKQLRLLAVYGLARLAGRPEGRAQEPVAAALERGLADSSAEVQGLSCLGLSAAHGGTGGTVVPARVRDRLLRLIERARARRGEDDGEVVAGACVHALGRLREAGAVPLLGELLREGNEEPERQAAWALGRSGDRRALVPLLRAVFLKGEPLRQVAGDALCGVGAGEGRADALIWPEPEGEGLNLDVRRLVERLPLPAPPCSAERTALLREGDAVVQVLSEALSGHRDLALRALADLAGPDEAELPHLGPLSQRLPAPALLPLRRQVARGLAAPLTRLVLADERPAAVRGAALALLMRLGRALPAAELPEEPAALLARLARAETALPVRAQAAELLALRFPARAPEVLGALLDSPDRRVRLLAVRAAARLGPAGQPLRTRAANDPDGYVRAAAQVR
jgi:HEAT repeat protein